MLRKMETRARRCFMVSQEERKIGFLYLHKTSAIAERRYIRYDINGKDKD